MADEPQNTPAQDSPQQDPPQDPPAERTITLTQAELDRKFQERVARERAKYSDYDNLKAKAGKFEELEQAQKTELQRAQERAAALERQAQEASQRAQENALRSAIVAEAARRNVVDPDAAFALIDRSAITFDDHSGEPTGVGGAMDSLLEQKKYLLGGTSRPAAGADQGARGGSTEQVAADVLKGKSPEEIVALYKGGKLEAALRG